MKTRDCPITGRSRFLYAGIVLSLNVPGVFLAKKGVSEGIMHDAQK